MEIQDRHITDSTLDDLHKGCPVRGRCRAPEDRTSVSPSVRTGGWRIRPTGRNGRGLARSASAAARPAAIKLSRRSASAEGPSHVSDETIRRFEREARAIASLRSPHTVELFDYGVSQDGAFYYAMELLEGYDAETLVERFGPLPPPRVVHVLRQVCHSLSEAEARGLVHRDIKAANIFLCRYGEDYDFVKVLDFGLVRALDEPAAAGPALTSENLIHGTPAFMAPEPATGDRELDGRADHYAVGAKEPAARPQTARDLARRLAEVALESRWTEELARAWWMQQGPGPELPTMLDPGLPRPWAR